MGESRQPRSEAQLGLSGGDRAEERAPALSPDDEVARRLRESLVVSLTAKGMSPVDANKLADMAEQMGREMGEIDVYEGHDGIEDPDEFEGWSGDA